MPFFQKPESAMKKASGTPVLSALYRHIYASTIRASVRPTTFETRCQIDVARTLAGHVCRISEKKAGLPALLRCSLSGDWVASIQSACVCLAAGLGGCWVGWGERGEEYLLALPTAYHSARVVCRISSGEIATFTSS